MGLLKTYALPMEDKMAAGAFRRARNYGCDVPKLKLFRAFDDLSRENSTLIERVCTC